MLQVKRRIQLHLVAMFRKMERGMGTGISGLFYPRDRASLLLAICGISFLVNYGRVAFAPLVDHFIQTGATPALAGLAATAVWFGSALPRLPTGWLLTFLRRHQVIFAVGGLLSVAAVGTAMAPDMWFVVAGAFAIGLAGGAFFIAANPMVSELYRDRVGVALGFRGLFSQLAAVVAPFLVAGTIMLGSWRLGFLAMAVATVIVSLWFRQNVRRVTLPTAGEADRDLIDGIRAQWRLILAGIAFVGLAGFVWQGVFNFYITYLSVEKGYSTGLATALLTVTFVAGLPSFIVGGRLADRFPYLVLLFAVLGGFVVSLIGLTVVDGFLSILVVSLVMGFIIHCMFPIGDTYMLASLPDKHRASAYAGFSAVMMLMQAPGSVVVGMLVGVGFSFATIFRSLALLVAGLIVLLGVLAVANVIPHGRPSTAEQGK